jgi:F-type H+-transporting ATPase subunit a
MNKLFLKNLLFFASVIPSVAFAGGGFTWLAGPAKALNIYEFILTFAFIAVLLLVVGVFYRVTLSNTPNSIIPDKNISFRNIIESFGQFIHGLAVGILGEKDAAKYFTVLASLFLFIFISNLIGLIPGFLPPTDNLNTTLALGLFVFVYYNFQGIKEQGLWGHIKHFMGPVWYMAFLIFPIEIISHSVRPMSLALRLRSVMMGDHMVLAIFSDIVPILVPVVFMFIGLFVCFIQAFVFTLLTMVYIGLAVEKHDHDSH